MLGNRLNNYISGSHILCLGNVHAKCIIGYTWADPEGDRVSGRPP